MQTLHLTNFLPKIQHKSGKKHIFCPIRKKYYLNSAEEWVRQQFIHFLNNHCGYPLALIGLEYEVIYQGKFCRADIVVFNSEGKIFLVVECKNNETKLNQTVFDQVQAYNSKIQAEWIVISNGLYFDIRQFDKTQNNFVVREALPILN